MKDPKKNVRKLLLLAVNFALIYGFLRLIILLGEKLMEPMIYYVGSTVYMVALGVLIIVYFTLNGGTFNTNMPQAEDLPEAWSLTEKQTYLEKCRRRREKAKKLLYVLLPLVVSVGISYIELWFFT